MSSAKKCSSQSSSVSAEAILFSRSRINTCRAIKNADEMPWQVDLLHFSCKSVIGGDAITTCHARHSQRFRGVPRASVVDSNNIKLFCSAFSVVVINQSKKSTKRLFLGSSKNSSLAFFLSLNLLYYEAENNCLKKFPTTQKHT